MAPDVAGYEGALRYNADSFGFCVLQPRFDQLTAYPFSFHLFRYFGVDENYMACSLMVLEIGNLSP